MKNYYAVYDKKLIIQKLPSMILNNTEDHDVFFVTFAFQNVHQMLDRAVYTNYLKAFYQKLNQFTLNRPSLKPEKKAKFILFPEKSHKSKTLHMNKSDHFHGFLLIHKDCRQKFDAKCTSTIEVVDPETGEIKNALRFINPLVNQERERIKIHNVDIQELSSKDDITTVSYYMTKRFESPEDKYLKFNLSELRAFQKPIAATRPSGKFANPYFSVDDIQIFCDISAFKKKNLPD